jgi:hypothetical protein
MVEVGSGSPAVTKKTAARVALVNLSPAAGNLLRECFRQFGIETMDVTENASARFGREKFEGCVLQLDDHAEAVLQAVRNSPSNRRMVVYGICATAQESIRYSKYGVNALLRDPVERQDALKVVRSTHLLVIHELRLYIRVPLASQARVTTDTGDVFSATTQELSGGGMSIQSDRLPRSGAFVTVQFDLPPGAQVSRVTLQGTVCWARTRDNSFGVRFEATDPARMHIKQWIDEYLDIT